MGKEIERRFLVKDNWKDYIDEHTKSSVINQVYLSTSPELTVRVRKDSEQGCTLTIKNKVTSLIRNEFEYEISDSDYTSMSAGNSSKRISKTRYRYFYESNLWEIDEFSGANNGLVVAEIELDSEEQEFEKPDFILSEITEDERYLNAMLVKEPYSDW